jgi:hypothetical protein
MRQVNLVLDSLHPNLRPSPDVGSGSTAFEAYRLVCFTLLAVQRNSTPGKSQLQSENLELRNEIARLQSAQLAERKTDKLSPVSPSDGSLARAKAKIRSLARKCNGLEESLRVRDIELEQLRAPSPPPTLIEFQDHDTSRFDKAVSALGNWIRQLTSELAAESTQRASLLSIIHKQSAALACAEQLAMRAIADRPVCDHSELLSALQHSNERAFNGTELGAQISALLTRPKPENYSKVFETLKSFIDNQSKNFRDANGRLTLYLSNILSFLGRLASSRDMQTWFIESQVEDDFRDVVLGQLRRLEDLLRKTGTTIPTCDNFSRFADRVQEVLRNSEPDPRELLLVIQILCLLNEASQKFVDRMAKQNNSLVAERRELHYELMQQEDAGEEVVKQITDEMGSQLKAAEAKAREQEELMRQAVRLLKQSAEPNAVIPKCLGILSGGFPETEEDTSFDSLARELKRTAQERDSAVDEKAGLSRELQRQSQNLEKAVREQLLLKRQLDETKRSLQDLERTCSSLRDEKQKLETSVAGLDETVAFQKEKIRLDKEEYQRNLSELADKEAARKEQLKQLESEAQRKVASQPFHRIT